MNVVAQHLPLPQLTSINHDIPLSPTAVIHSSTTDPDYTSTSNSVVPSLSSEMCLYSDVPPLAMRPMVYYAPRGAKIFGDKWQWYDQWVTCSFCQRIGHIARICPFHVHLNECSNAFSAMVISSSRRRVTCTVLTGSFSDIKNRLHSDAFLIQSRNPSVGSPNVNEHLKSNIGYWHAIGASTTVLWWLIEGIPLRMDPQHPPNRIAFRNHPSYFKHIPFVQEQMDIHVKSGAYIIVDQRFAHIINPLQCEPKKDGPKLRLCMDARYTNYHLPHIFFRMETLCRDVSKIVDDPTLLLFTIDIDAAYYSIPIHPKSWKYLCWIHDGKCYASTVLPFGVGPAPMFFTKVLRCVVAFLHSIGIRVVSYIDDFLFAVHANTAESTLEFVVWLFEQLGFRIKFKTGRRPSQSVEFLGFIVDAKEGRFIVPRSKAVAALAIIESMLTSISITTHELAVIAGKLGSMHVAIPTTLAWTMEMIRLSHSDKDVTLSDYPELMEELNYWKATLSSPARLTRQFRFLSSDCIRMHCDSGDATWGAHLFNMDVKTSGYLPLTSIGRSSTHREIAGLIEATMELKSELSKRQVTVVMDSHAAIRALTKEGSMKVDLVQLIKTWYQLCMDNNIYVQLEWISRDKNKLADSLARQHSSSYIISDVFVERVQQRFDVQRHQIIHPQWGRINTQLDDSKSKGCVIITPEWPSASWWVRLISMSSQSIDNLRIDEVFEYLGKRASPQWRFRASLISS